LEPRIGGLHPALQNVHITHRWMGPLCLTNDSKPLIATVDDDRRVLVATGYRGHGVALSARVGKLLAAVLAGESDLPSWSDRSRSR
jgi:glycine/D-amino acid oxidase-like deaminating enzyme